MNIQKDNVIRILSRNYKRSVVLTFSGWILLFAYIFYDYVIYGHYFFEHFVYPPHLYELFFHLLISLAPFISAFVGYQDCKKTSLIIELEEMTEKWKKTYDAIPDLIFILDKNYNIIDANKASIDRFGVDIIGGQCYNYMHNTDMPIKTCPHKRCIETGMIIREEIEEPPLSGLFYEVTCSPILSRDGHAIGSVHVVKDITAKKKAEDEKKRLEAQLYQAQKMESIGRFAGGIAHDFNNLLTAITGFAGIIQSTMDKEDPNSVYINHILSASGKASTLTSSILAFSRTKTINPRPVNINETIKSIERLLARIIGEDIELKTYLGSNDLTVNADEGQIEQVLMNLATNARDAMPDGGALVIETGSVNLDEGYADEHINIKEGEYALISVTDTGDGMDEDTKNRIFEPFFTTKEIGKGTGLGLAVVYGIVKQHDGHINVYSEKGKGTTFKIYLPLIDKGYPDIDKTEHIYDEALQGSETVLVAEDSPEVMEIIVNVLTENGYRVIKAMDGIDAIEKFRENKDDIHLFLSDIVMPKINGKEAYNEIRKFNPDIKALFMSGYTANIIQQDAATEQDIPVISKPFTSSELLKKIRETLKPF